MKTKQMPSLIVLAVLLSVPGCALFNQGGDPASSFTSFQDTWTVASAAYDAHCERVVLGKVDITKEKLADTAWNQFRATFRASFLAASQNWSAPPPMEVKTQAANLLSTLNAE